MRKNLLEFLFGDAVVRESSQNLGEQVVKLFEEAADEETEEMVATKEPLTTALKSLGIDKGVEAVSQACELTCDSPEQYREYVRILFNPENLHKLASKGWVPAKMGDVAMTFEPAELKLGFIEITTAETGDKDKAPDLEKVLKDAQKFAATEPEHDDDNPVEFDDKTSKDRKKGVGDAKDGAAPEGKPKGASKTSESKRHVQEFYAMECPTCKTGGIGDKCSKCGGKLVPIGSGDKEKPKHTPGPDSQPIRFGGKYTRNNESVRRRKTAKQVAESMLDEMTSTGSMGTVDGPPMGANTPNWKARLKALRKRRGEPTDDDAP